MLINRFIKKQIIEASKTFKVILLTGPRQVGKTTLLKELSKNNRSYVTLDDIDNRILAQRDPKLFLAQIDYPVLIDEVQYAPELFSYIKIKVDEDKIPGQFWLTGSQQFAMMKNISDSLAGRVAIFDMLGISNSEEEKNSNQYFLPTLENIKKRQRQNKILSVNEIFNKIWRGSFPDVVVEQGKNWERYYSSYLTSYVEKDVRDYLKINDLVAFRKFLQIAASRTSQTLNYSSMANDVGVSVSSIQTWVNILIATGHVTLIQPYFNNHAKRAIKSPKLHFLDTGLCCYLTGWLNPSTLQKGAMSGALVESYVTSEIIKSYINNGKKPPLYYYRDKEKNEVDLVIEDSGVIYPVEIKKAAAINNLNFKGFDFLKSLKKPLGQGLVLCFSDKLKMIDSEIAAASINII